MRTRVLQQFLAVSALIALTGCGGGGDSGPSSPMPPPAAAPPPAAPQFPPQLPPAPPSPSPAPTSVAPYYLASEAGPSFSGWMNTNLGVSRIESQHLVIVDSASPTTPLALEAAGQWWPVAQIDEGVTDVAMGSISNLGVRFVTYLKGGRLYGLDLRRATWPPAPRLVSALQTTDLCRLVASAIQDRKSAERSVLIFEVGVGPDLRCNSSAILAVRLDMTETDPPLSADAQFLAALRTGDGAVTGFVVRRGNQIQKVDQNFANPIDLFSLSSPTNRLHVIDNGERPNAPHTQLLFVDGRDVRAFNLSSGSGPVTLFTLAPGEFLDRAAASDSNNVYLIVNGDRSGRLIRASDSLTAQLIASEPTSRIYEVLPTSTRLVYLVVGAQGVEYRSVPKAGGAAMTVAPGQPCPDLSSFFTVGETVWYDCAPLGFWDGPGWLNPPQGLPINPIFGLVRSDGAQMEELNNLERIGTSSLDPLPLRPDASTVYSVIVASINASGARFANATLRAFEGASRRELLTYGVLPSSAFRLQTARGRSAQWGQPGLLALGGDVALPSGGVSFQTDIFFYQSNAPGLTRVTAFVP
jgi:hypothetical protein